MVVVDQQAVKHSYNMTHPKGYFKYSLAVDCETTGIALGNDDPSYDAKTGETYQAISWGLIVVDTDTLKRVEQLYVEVQWDGKSKWSETAERVHGLSKEHLKANGVSVESAVILIGELILKYWGPNSAVSLIGHNVTTFDLPFLRRTLRSQGLEIKFSNRHVDTNSIGYAAFNTYNSDDLFNLVGLPDRDPNKHNSLTDAQNALRVVRVVRSIYNHVLST